MGVQINVDLWGGGGGERAREREGEIESDRASARGG